MKRGTRGQLLMAGAFFVLFAGFFGPAAFAGQTNSNGFTFTTASANGTRVMTSVAPTIPATDLNTSSGTVASTVPASATVVETFAAGANFTVTAQVCGPANGHALTSTQAALASAGCTGTNSTPNEIDGYNTTSGAFLTTIAG